MGIIQDLTPTYYRLTRIGVQKSNGDVIAIADMQILNADGQQLKTHNPSTSLTANEKQVLAGWLGRELAAVSVMESSDRPLMTDRSISHAFRGLNSKLLPQLEWRFVRTTTGSECVGRDAKPGIESLLTRSWTGGEKPRFGGRVVGQAGQKNPVLAPIMGFWSIGSVAGPVAHNGLSWLKTRRPVPKPASGPVARLERLGGILSHYYRKAA